MRALGATAALLLAAVTGTSAAGGDRVGPAPASPSPVVVNRLDSNLLDDPNQAAGPTLAVAVAVAGSPGGRDGAEAEPEAPINRRSRHRVVL